MVQSRSSGDGLLAILPIHFDLPAHAIPLHTFVRTAEQAEVIIASLNRELFDGKLKYEMLVLPPQEGSFKSRIGVYLFGGWLAVWTFTESDIGQAFIRGLTLQEPAHWAEQAGSAIREQIVSNDDDGNTGEADDASADDEANCHAAAEFLVDATKSFLQTDVAELESVGITTTRFRDGFSARNEFYEACAATPDIRAVGFEDEPVFPINRSGFARLQVVLPPVKDENDEPWLTDIVDLKVTSPNWEREDRHRSWKARDAKGRERLFRIEDEEFWGLVKAEQLNIHIMDTIKVQWAFQGKASSPKNIRVLRVLEFNGDVLSDALDDNALAAILGAHSEIATDQGDLFADRGGQRVE
ncbi:hypothetical protein L598_002900000080 [Mesorhizobium sp. J18]|uniref:hypothetical protein n=1 Tax=Mesorhizobium sp. J18 TaxID=935263 RepID=UPI001198D4F4|nr:hypothetical protein [Mesorhizobium sp. J18]TWG95870.1 hypothetical protein L598_002900000080 [Mesorhizobium sp. J18]